MQPEENKQTTINQPLPCKIKMQPLDGRLIRLILLLMVNHICFGGSVVVLHFLVKCGQASYSPVEFEAYG